MPAQGGAGGGSGSGLKGKREDPIVTGKHKNIVLRNAVPQTPKIAKVVVAQHKCMVAFAHLCVWVTACAIEFVQTENAQCSCATATHDKRFTVGQIQSVGDLKNKQNGLYPFALQS